MKYPCECVYVSKSGNVSTVNTAVDGFVKMLRHKGGKLNITIKVKRREALYMYINQIVTGVEANKLKFKDYISDISGLSDFYKGVLNTKVVDKTASYKAVNKDKQTIGFYEIELFYEDIVP